jgi:pimeloyl-ACP methyl ester carboxylesterase
MGVDGFVLVHGGYHGAWCWDPVRPKLALPSVAVDLPGRGTRPLTEKPVTIDQCVEAVMADADAAGLSTMVLVGHSMGGITITEVVNRHPDRVAHLVYVAALVLPPGGTVFDLYSLDPASAAANPAGVMPLMPESVAHQMFAADLSPEAFAPAHAQCVPEPVGLFAATVSGYDSGVPATYLHCGRDGAVSGEVTEQMVERLRPETVHDIDADHDIMLSQPDLVADLLNGVADNLTSGQGTSAV